MSPTASTLRARALAHLADANAALARAQTCLDEGLQLENADRAGALAQMVNGLAAEVVAQEAETAYAKRRPAVQDVPMRGVVVESAEERTLRGHLDKARVRHPDIVLLEATLPQASVPFVADAIAAEQVRDAVSALVERLDPTRARS